MLVFTQLAADNFDRTETPLSDGGNWQTPTYWNYLTCNGGSVAGFGTPGGGTGISAEMYTGISWPDNQWASFSPGGDFADVAYVILRATAVADSGDPPASVLNGCVFRFGGAIAPNTANVEVSSALKRTDSPSPFWSLTNLPIVATDTVLFAVIGNVLFIYQNETLLGSFTDTNNLYSSGSVVLSVNEGGNVMTQFVGGLPSYPPSVPSKIPLPFTLRTTAAVTLFACLQAAISAQKLTTDSATMLALQILRHQMFTTYRTLQHQDVANQKSKLDAAVSDAQAEIDNLYAVVASMPAAVPLTDDVNALPNIVAVVAAAVQQISNCVVDE
jgi:hypothetical protein